MFKLKYSTSTSSPSLSSAPSSSPCPPLRSSTSALTVLQQQRQQQRGTSPVLQHSARTRSSSLLPPSPRHRPPSPSKSLPTTARKKQKSKTTPACEAVGDDCSTAEGDVSMAESVALPATPSHQSTMAISSTPNEANEGNNDDEWGAGASASQNVVVCVRVRPGGSDCREELWSMNAETNRIMPTDQHPSLAKRNNHLSSTPASANSSMMANSSPSSDGAENGALDFRFDSLVLPSMDTNAVYQANISPVVDAAVKGYNGTVFAYGQTGSGKTHTMSGSGSEKGVIPRAVEEVFSSVEKDTSREFLLRVSYLEIYNETLRDLLAPYPSSASCTDLTARPASPIKGGSSHVAGGSDSTSLRILEAGGRIQIQGLREEIVTNASEVLNLLEWGQRGRHQAATDWNERSSRSHCVFILTLESREQSKSSKDVRFSQLNLIDLAGSERAASEKERRKEGAFINKSLLTLGTVIAKLSEQSQTGNEETHIPYRDSKLTRLLQTSLGGNARVAVVCTLSPRKEHGVESLSTLRFGQRCKMVVTKAKRGTIVSDKALIARYRKELERLRGQLEQGNTTMELGVMSVDDPSIKALQSRREEAEQGVREMNDKRDELKKQVEHLTRLILTGKDVAGADGIGNDSSKAMAASGRARRVARMSDLGTSSPSKRQKVFEDPRGILTSSEQENAPTVPFMKPFAMESELAALRKGLAAAMAGRQASEEARVQETQLWRARVMELEASNTEQEEELDEAEVAFEKLKDDRDSIRAQMEEEREANRLLKLIAKSRGADVDEGQKRMLEQSQATVERLERELKAANEKVQDVERRREEEVAVLRSEIARLEERLAQEQEKAAKADEWYRQLQSLKAAQSEGSKGVEEVAALREELRATVEAKEQVQKELKAANLERGQEDAERDFADLVKSGEETAGLVKELAGKEEKLKERELEMQELQRELVEVKLKVKPLPVPTHPATSSMSDNLRGVMEKQLKQSEERSRGLEQQMENLKRSEAAAVDRQAAQIASLERQLLEAKKTKAPGSPLKGSFSTTMDSPSTNTRRGSSTRLDNVLQRVSAGRGSAGGSTSLQRGGSLREYKRYSASNELAGSNNVALEQAVKAEREEIERLSGVIGSQRGIMSELESSVAAWKTKLRAQHDIITRLVESGGGDKVVIPEELRVAVERSDIKRTSSSASTATNSPVPYYGAHIYNRPPADWGMTPSSPTKAPSWLASMPSFKPDPLPLPNALSSSSGKAKRRPTIEHEIQELKGSPRIKSTTNRLLEPKSSRPLPIPGSPGKMRPSKDYYI